MTKRDGYCTPSQPDHNIEIDLAKFGLDAQQESLLVRHSRLESKRVSYNLEFWTTVGYGGLLLWAWATLGYSGLLGGPGPMGPGGQEQTSKGTIPFKAKQPNITGSHAPK